MSSPPESREAEPTAEAIVAAAVAQFDAGPTPPSTESIAAALGVEPAAVARHFASRTELIQACVESVWNESVTELLALVPDPLDADPEMVLVAIGVATRRAWQRHFRLAPYLAASPSENDFLERSVVLMTNLFGRLVEDPEGAAAAFHAYSAFMIGAVLFAASRRLADEQLGLQPGAGVIGSAADDGAPPTAGDGDPIRAALDRMVALGNDDPAGDEELFVRGLRRLVASLVSA